MEGHLHKRVRTNKDGRQATTWYVIVEMERGPDGHRRQKWHGGFRTRKEAEAAKAKFVNEINTGVYVAPGRTTLGDWVEASWLSILPQRTAGIASAAGRSWDKAEEHFRTALRQAAALPHLPEAAHTRRFFAAMLLERNAPSDRAEAATLIDEARELYGRMGMPKHAAMLDALRD